MSPYADLKNWVSLNADILSGRTIEEISDLAIACGFDRQAVAHWRVSETFKKAANQ